jgi:putative lipoic acid-binding regulatory protein
MKTNDTNNGAESAIKYPCEFPIKAMGLASTSLQLTILDIVQRHAPEADDSKLKSRPSSNGKYLSITVTITAQSREQLDAIYTDLSACEHVLMAL